MKNKPSFKLVAIVSVMVALFSLYGYSQDLTSFQQDGKWGYKNPSDEVVIPAQFDSAGAFSKYGLAKVGVKNPGDIYLKYGFINKSGEVIIPLKYDAVQWFSYNRAAVKVGKKWGFIDRDGNEVVEPKYDEVGHFNDFVIAKVRLGSKYGFIDKNGSIVIDIIYDQIDPFDTFFNNEDGFFTLARVRIGDFYGIIDLDGNTVVPVEYDFIGGWKTQQYSEGLIQVRKKWRWGYVDGFGNIVIPIEYNDANPFNNGRATVKKGNQTFQIDRNGERVN